MDRRRRWSPSSRAHRGIVAVVAALLVTVAAVGCSSDDGSGGSSGSSGSSGAAGPADAAGTPEAFTGDDFYAVPDPLPAGEHGTLVRYERLEDRDVDGGQVWRVMYLSESVAGDPVVDTGIVVVPTGEPAAGGWKLLTIAHGTTGVADECTPSADEDDLVTALSGDIVEAGYVLAATDYEGLGTPGIHPYLVGESEGRAVIDAATAAHQLPDVEVGDRYAVFGYSQGGHAAVWANQLAADWAPDLDLVGTVAGAPPSEMEAIFQSLGTTPISPDFFFMMIAGYHAAYPEADLSLVLTPAGEELLPAVENGCYEVGDALGDQSWSDMIQPGFATAEPWPTLMAENDPGHVAVDSPLLILHSAADDVVPVGLSQSLFDRLCGLGQVVERRVYDKGQGHGEAVPDAVTDGFAWIEGRMAGDPAVSTCPGG